ncbi:MAG: peptidyl-prolyl cis-trans isomerase, partial [Candidatus Aureabacteria bacterium]|nr:peptidyl-prolyl cis-trans isomerase [Candidatus Auribacterota bacterium]
RYEAFVTQHLRIPLNQFEHMARESLSIQKLADEIEKNVTISSAEAEAFFREEENKIEFVYAKVESRLFENKVEVSDDKLEEYFKNHSDDFQIPEQVRLNTVLILKDSIQKDQVVSEEEMRAYYEENRESFTESKPAEKSGEVKENDTTPSYKSFESVKEEIRKRLTGIKTEEAGENVSDALYRQMVEKNNFADVAKGNSLEIKQTEWFSRPNPPQEIGGASSQQVRDAFDLTVKDFCGPYRVNNGWLILEVDAKEPSRSPSDWKEVRHLVEEAYRKTQAPLLAEKEAEILRQKVLAHSEKNFEQAVNLLGGVCGVSGLVSMKSGYIAGLGSHKEVLEKAFKLKENEFSEIIPVDNRAKFIFCQVVKRVSPDMEKFQKNKDKVRERALEEKRQKELYQWMNTVRKEAAVKVTAERTNAAVPPDTAEED